MNRNDSDIDLQTLGISKEEACELREKFTTFEVGTIPGSTFIKIMTTPN